MVSVIIPARNEKFLQNTIDDIFKNAEGEIEVIVNLDGYWPTPPLKDDPRLRIIHQGVARGMRHGINAGVAIARGEYILKSDAHCMFDKGFDVKLVAVHRNNWVQIPRRKRLDAENWAIQDVQKPDVDAMYLSYPDDPNDFGGPGLNGKLWQARAVDRTSILIDDEMSFQGSAWFMTKKYFYELELMDEANYGPFWNEAQEIGLKCWLSGGRVIRNKTTWYAHLHKGKKYGRMYDLDHSWLAWGAKFTKGWMFTDKYWHKQTIPFNWLIKKFWPVPGWPADWLKTSGLPLDDSLPIVPSRSALAELFASEGFKKGAEIGVSGGRFSEVLCNKIPELKLYCIDTWKTYRANRTSNDDGLRDHKLEEAKRRTEGKDVTFIQKYSMEALAEIPDESLDFVYIDANHDFKHTYEDIVGWTKKVRKGGIVSGHDYYHFNNSGVIEAIEKYARENNIDFKITWPNTTGRPDDKHPSWYFRKQ